MWGSAGSASSSTTAAPPRSAATSISAAPFAATAPIGLNDGVLDVTGASGGVLRIAGDGPASSSSRAAAQVGNLVVIGESYGSHGSYELRGGTLNAGGVFVGDNGKGSFLQIAGTHNVGDLLLGVYGPSGGSPLSEGSYRLEGGGLNSSQVTVGNEGGGHFVQVGGTHTIAWGMTIGNTAGSEGRYDLQGGCSMPAAS